MKARYSGPLSVKFWERVLATRGMKLYASACRLQEREALVLRQLAKAEQKLKQVGKEGV